MAPPAPPAHAVYTTQVQQAQQAQQAQQVQQGQQIQQIQTQHTQQTQQLKQTLHVPLQQIGMHKRVPTNEQNDYLGKIERSPTIFPQQRNVSMPPVFLYSQPTPDLSQQQYNSVGGGLTINNRMASPFLRPNSASSGGENRSVSPPKMAFDPFTHIQSLSKESLVSTAGTSFSTPLDSLDRTLSVSPASSNETFSTTTSVNNVNNSASNSIIHPIGTRPESANSQKSGSLSSTKGTPQLHLPQIPAFETDDSDGDHNDDPIETYSNHSSKSGVIGMSQSTSGSGAHINPLGWSKVWGTSGVGNASKGPASMTSTSVWG